MSLLCLILFLFVFVFIFICCNICIYSLSWSVCLKPCPQHLVPGSEQTLNEYLLSKWMNDRYCYSIWFQSTAGLCLLLPLRFGEFILRLHFYHCGCSRPTLYKLLVRSTLSLWEKQFFSRIHWPSSSARKTTHKKLFLLYDPFSWWDLPWHEWVLLRVSLGWWKSWKTAS